MTRIASIAAMLALFASISVCGAERQQAPQRAIHVCVSAKGLVSPLLLKQATYFTARLFANIEIDLDWMNSADCDQQAHDIDISFVRTAPADADRMSLARAYPYGTGATHIVVFWSRVEPFTRAYNPRSAIMFAHILAHEIGHVLQGVACHSDAGIMRAKWEPSDIAQMMRNGLDFTAEDRELMRLNLAAKDRAAVVVARNFAR